jgi:tetratricopeptide (TPR) repeat protein
MKVKKAQPKQQLSNGRKRIFSIISILLPFIFLILLEIILRVTGYGDNHSLFITHPDEGFENYYVVNPEIGKKYFQKMEYSAPAKDRFLKKKPDDVFRIFVMGSSSVVGFPYDNNIMFSRILSERLHDAYPGKKIEMVNTAITAINSFTLADFMPQIIEQKPDAILIYAGHNEFYGAFGVGSNEAFFHSPALIKMHLNLMNYRVYQLVVNTMVHVTSMFKSSDQKRGTLMSRMVKDVDIIYGSKTYKEGLNNYEQNMSAMLELAKKKNIPVFFSDMVSNLKNVKPFKSIASGELKGADEYFNAAKQYEQQGNMQKAKENYLLARDYDCIRFRASSDINAIIKKLADKYQAHFVPTYELFNHKSPNGIVGNNLLTEHVHPNIEGYFLLSESFYNAIVQSKVIAANIHEENVRNFSSFMKDYGYSRLDTLIGYHRITNLKYHWPFRDESKEYIDYRNIYQPKGLEDSLAFNVMAKQNFTMIEAHEIMADKYLHQGNYFKAWKEYNSLAMINPYRSLYFRKAADCLLKMNDLPESLRFFERSTELEDNFYAHFRSGEICMIKNDFERAIVHFQKAQGKANKEEKEKALFKIYQALTYLNRTEEGKEIAGYFRQNYPNRPLSVPPRTNTLGDYIPVQIKSQVEEAQKSADAKDYSKAIAILLEALEIKEAPVASKLLGEYYFKTKEFEKSEQYLNKAYQDFKFDPSFLSSLIMVELALNNSDNAKNTFEQLRKTAPNYPSIAQFQLILNNPGSSSRGQMPAL